MLGRCFVAVYSLPMYSLFTCIKKCCRRVYSMCGIISNHSQFNFGICKDVLVKLVPQFQTRKDTSLERFSRIPILWPRWSKLDGSSTRCLMLAVRHGARRTILVERDEVLQLRMLQTHVKNFLGGDASVHSLLQRPNLTCIPRMNNTVQSL